MSLLVNIEKQLGAFHLKVDFEVESEVVSLLGASGCGKSMTLKCIAGIEKPDKGRIVLNDRVLFDSEKHINLKPQNRRVGYLFQQYALFPNMTVYDNISCGIRKEPKKSKEEKNIIVLNMMEKVGLSGQEKKLPSQLSGGQQQRVALARILVNEPDLLLLDEPFSALDSYLRLQMEKEVADLVKEYDHPVLFVSHDRDEVYRLSDKIAIMDNGLITAFGTKLDVFSEPGSVRGAMLTGIVNISKVDVIGDGKIYAEDYGVELEIEGNLNGVNAIGIPDKCIRLLPEIEKHRMMPGDMYNLFDAKIIDKIDNPDSSTLMLSLDGSNDRFITVEILKRDLRIVKGETIYVTIAPKGIRLLRH